jgi:tetratricopeptide (TPR) repeat protein
MILLKSSLLIVLINLYAASQGKEPDIKRRLEMINSGRITEVRKELISLKKSYPNNAGVYYLQAVLTEKGDESEKLYSNIVKKYPKTEWAKKSLYQLYYYYILSENSKKAKEKYSQILKNDPKFKDESIKKSGSYTIQVGAFSTNEKAKVFSDHLKKLNYKPEINTRKVDERLLYIVNIGKFSTKSDAERTQKNIETKLDIASIIIPR